MDKNIIIRKAIITDCYALSVLKREVWHIHIKEYIRPEHYLLWE